MWDFETIGSYGDDGEGTWGVGVEEVVDLVEGDGVDGVFDFVESADAAAHEEVMGDGGGAGAGGFALHDGGGFEADFGALEFVGGDAVCEAVDFVDEGIEGSLSAVIAGAGVAHDGAEAFEAGVSCPDAVDEGAFFADFGEESAAHAAAEDFDGESHDVVEWVGFLDGGPGEADMGLFAGMLDVEVAERSWGGIGVGVRGGWPIGKEFFGELAEGGEVDVACEGEDGVVWEVEFLVLLFAEFEGEVE